MNPRQTISLLDAIQWTYKTLSTDPRDKIFALLGLCYDGPDIVPTPNYQQSLETILIHMSKAMMRRNRSLDLIGMRGVGPKCLSNLPTWVPDWPRIWASGMTIQKSKFEDWQNSFESIPILDGSTNNILKVEGRYVAAVRNISSEMDRNFKFEERISDPYWLRLELAYKNFLLYDSGRYKVLKEYDAIGKALTMSLLPPDFPIEVSRSCFSVLWTPEGRGAIANLALVEWLDSNVDFKHLGRTLREWSQIKIRLRHKHTGEQLNIFIAAIEQALSGGMRLAIAGRGRGIFTTDSLVMVHRDVQGGDKIYMLSACSIPVVLRPPVSPSLPEISDTDYHVIGGVRHWNEMTCRDGMRTPDNNIAPLQILTLR